MKPFKSIKWRLQLWYGLILVAVLAGFGFTAYQVERSRQFRRIDDELHRRMGLLVMALRPHPHGPKPGEPPFDWPSPVEFPGERPRRENPTSPAEFHLPTQAAGLFDTNSPNGFYFEVLSHGKQIARSANWPELTFTVGSPPYMAVNALPKLGKPPEPVTVENFRKYHRVLHERTPSGESIYVGVSLLPEFNELHLTAWKLTGIGAIILAFGLAGGWWIASRAIRPIADISATAAKISSGDLSQRISTAETESELGQLASVLNSTFARLETAFAQQRQFTADAAHELRTPVSVMLTQTQTVLNRERNATEYRETIEACQRSAQRMRRLIESLLELARLDAGQEPMKRLKFDLSQTAWDCVELIRPLAAERGINIHCDLPAVEGHGDAERLAQVLTNLLANAIQYNKPYGEVRLSVKLQGSMILLIVSDAGPGISREDLPHVFERFYRADPSRSSGQTGLGLAISKAIVEAHGGTIEVMSKPGIGTTFTVVLPA